MRVFERVKYVLKMMPVFWAGCMFLEFWIFPKRYCKSMWVKGPKKLELILFFSMTIVFSATFFIFFQTSNFDFDRFAAPLATRIYSISFESLNKDQLDLSVTPLLRYFICTLSTSFYIVLCSWRMKAKVHDCIIIKI